MGPNCGNGGPIIVGPAKLDLPVGRTILPKWTSDVRAGFGPRSNPNGPIRTASDTEIGRPGGDALT
jgi:hypothetical protein